MARRSRRSLRIGREFQNSFMAPLPYSSLTRGSTTA